MKMEDARMYSTEGKGREGRRTNVGGLGDKREAPEKPTGSADNIRGRDSRFGDRDRGGSNLRKLEGG